MYINIMKEKEKEHKYYMAVPDVNQSLSWSIINYYNKYVL